VECRGLGFVVFWLLCNLMMMLMNTIVSAVVCVYLVVAIEKSVAECSPASIATICDDNRFYLAYFMKHTFISPSIILPQQQLIRYHHLKHLHHLLHPPNCLRSHQMNIKFYSPATGNAESVHSAARGVQASSYRPHKSTMATCERRLSSDD
jgi:hypothetical protein